MKRELTSSNLFEDFPSTTARQNMSESPANSESETEELTTLRRNFQHFCSDIYATPQERACAVGVLNPNALHIEGQFALCSCVGSSPAGWFDISLATHLVSIEELVQFIERYDFPAWHIFTDENGEPWYQGSHLGIACDDYLPSLSGIDRSTFPQDGLVYTDRFYAFIEACEEARRAGYIFFDTTLQDNDSKSARHESQNVLVDIVRTKMRARRAS